MTIIDAPPFIRCDWLLTIPKACARLQADPPQTVEIFRELRIQLCCSVLRRRHSHYVHDRCRRRWPSCVLVELCGDLHLRIYHCGCARRGLFRPSCGWIYLLLGGRVRWEALGQTLRLHGCVVEHYRVDYICGKQLSGDCQFSFVGDHCFRTPIYDGHE